MGALEAKVREAFAQQGALSRAADQFRERSGQTEMALAVARVIDQGGQLVVEAGTGVGKTFSYLVPALLSGERVLLSTATKTLQDQLFGRDLPRLVEATTPDELLLRRLKKRRLALRDQIERLVRQLDPQEPA